MCFVLYFPHYKPIIYPLICNGAAHEKGVPLFKDESFDSNPLNQINELKEVANRNGWVIVKEYVDAGISGAKGRDKRPHRCHVEIQ